MEKFLNDLLFSRGMSGISWLLKSAALGIMESDGLERRLKFEGVNVEGSRKFTIVAEEQEFEISYDGANVIMERMASPTPFLVRVPALLVRTREILGEDASVRAYISTSSRVVNYAKDVREIVTRKIIDDKKIYHGHSELVVDEANPVSLYYMGDKNKPDDKPRIDFPGELRGNLGIVNLLNSRYRARPVSSEHFLIFELDEPLQSFGDFVALTREVANELQAGRYFVESTEIEIPLKELRFLKRPPTLAVTSDKPYRMHYACEPPYSPFDRQDGVHELKRLRLEIPLNELAKATEFYDGLREKQGIYSR